MICRFDQIGWDSIEVMDMRTISADGNKHTEVAFLSTADFHGKYWDRNILSGEPLPGNMLRVSAAVRQIREEYGGENVLLADAGDAYPGTAESQLSIAGYGRGDNDRSPALSVCLKEIGYDVYVPGNHDFDYEWPVMKAVYEDLENGGVSVLAANYYYDGSDGVHACGEHAFRPYIIKSISVCGHEHRIGIVGFGNTDMSRWISSSKAPGMVFTHPDNREWSMAAEAAGCISQMREKGCEFITVVYHGGAGDPSGPLIPNINTEHQAKRLVEGTEGIGLMIAGHDHMISYSNTLVTDLSGRQVYLVNSGGYELTKTVIRFSEDEGGALIWEYVSGENVDLSGYEPDRQLQTLLQPYIDEAEAAVSRPIGRIEGDWDQSTLHYTQQTDTMNLIGQAMLDIGTRGLKKKAEQQPGFAEELDHPDADVSMTSVASNYYAVKAGDVSARDVYRMYQFSNTLVAVKARGRDIRAILEENAETRLGARLHRGRPMFYTKNDAFTNVIAGGLDFTYDMTKPAGERVMITGLSNGREFTEDGIYILVTIAFYMGNNNCGLRIFGREDILWSQDETYPDRDVQSLLTEYIERRCEQEGAIRPDAKWRWSISYPPEAENAERPGRIIAAVLADKVEDGHSYVIYQEAAGCALTGTGHNSRLEIRECEEYADSLTGPLPGDTAVFTVHKRSGDDFYLTDREGRYLTTTGKGDLFLSREKGGCDSSAWKMSIVDGGCNIVNTCYETVGINIYNNVANTFRVQNPGTGTNIFNFYEVK